MAARQTTWMTLLVLLLSMVSTGVQAQCSAGLGLAPGSSAMSHQGLDAAQCSMDCCGHQHTGRHQHGPSGAVQGCELSLPATVLSADLNDSLVLVTDVAMASFAGSMFVAPARPPTLERLGPAMPPLIYLPLRI